MMSGWGRWAAALLLLFCCVLRGRTASAGDPAAEHTVIVRQVLMLEDDERFSGADYDDSAWANVTVPAEWPAKGLGTIGWYRMHFGVDSTRPPSALYLGRVTGALEVFVNGTHVASWGRIAQHYVSHYGPTKVVVLPPELLHDGDNVLAVRVLDTWIGGLAYNPIRIGAAPELELMHAEDLWIDRLVHSVVLAFWLLLGLSLLGLLALGHRSLVLACTLVCVLVNIQWTAHESSLGDLVGRTVGWELFDALSMFVAAAAVSVLLLAHTHLLKRRDLFTVSLGIAFMVPPLMLAPLWALRSGWWTATFAVVSVWFAVLSVRIWSARHRIEFDVLLGSLIVAVFALTSLEVGGSIFDWPPLVKRFLSHVILLVWIGALAVQTCRQYLRERSRLREIPDEITRARQSERVRVAHELHDGIAQELQVVSLQLQALKGAEDRGQDLELVTRQLKEALSQMRAVTRDLNSGRIETNLADRLTAQAEAIGRVGTATVNVKACQETAEQLDAEASHQLFRIFQQALSNAFEHASPAEVMVTLSGGDEGVELSVSDDGRGFDARAVRSGVGFQSMRERALLLGGRCEIESGGAGTVVRVRVPYRAQA